MFTNNRKPNPSFSDSTRSAHSYSLALQIIGLALAYFITGKLGTFLAIPPGYATAIWPSSGIALAGILIYGYRVWPGIILGSFLVNLSTALVSGSPTETFISIIITLVISVGASLQAVAGAYLVRRYADYPNPLTSEKAVFSFLLFAGILASLVNSTIAVSTLVATSRILLTNFLPNWRTWWMGDVLGIFIFTPLLLAWLPQPGETWRDRRLAISLPIIAMFVLTTAAVFYESQNESQRLKLEFDQHASELNVALEKSLGTHLNVLRSLGSFYAASNTVDHEEFRSFVAQPLHDFPGIQALEWTPLTFSAEREAFETSLKQQGYLNSQITEKNADKQQGRAANRPAYVPVSFVEPYQGNETALGYDLYSDPLRRIAIDKARDSGNIATTAPILLVQEKGSQQGILAFLPVYRNGLPHQTLEQRQSNITGFIVGVFRGGDIVAAALKTLNQKQLSYRLIDENAAKTEQLLFSSDQKYLTPLVMQESGLFGKNISLASKFIVPVGDRSWRFEVIPTQEFFAQHHSANAWLILLGGLILTSMVGVFTLVSSGRENLLRRLVEERTAALTESEQRFRIVADAAPVLIWLADTDKLCFWFNQTWLDFTGRTLEQEAGNGWAEGLHPEDLQRCLALYIDHFDRQVPFHMEYRLKHQDGGYRWIHDNGVPRFDSTGLFSGYIGSCTDITAMRQARDQLQISHNQFAELSRQVPGAIYQYQLFPDGHSCFPYASDGIRDIYEVEPDQVSTDAASVLKILHSDDYDSVVASIQESALTLNPWQLEYRVKLPKKGVRWLSGQARPEKLIDGSTLWHGFIADISERHEREHQFGLYQRLFELTSDCVYMISPRQDFKFVFVNDATCQHYGVEREQLLKWRIPDWDPSFKNQADLDALWQEIKINKGFMVETSHRVASGREIPVEVSGNYLSYQGEEYIAGYFHDITERKKIEEVTKTNAQYARSLLEASLDPLVTISSEGKITDVNTATEQVTGVDRNVLIGNDFADYFTEPEKARAGYQQAFLQGFVTNYPLSIQNRSGKTTRVLYNASVYCDDKGKVLGVFAAARDITEQIVVRNKASAAKKALESILAAATEISIIATDANGLITMFNCGAELMLGYSSEELVGKQTPVIIHSPEEVEQRGRELSIELGHPVSGFNIFVEMTAQTGSETREWTYLRKDQSSLTVTLVVTTIRNQHNEITGYLGIAEDITKRKQAEQVLRQAKESAEAHTKAKSEFIANMSHEIRTPMNAIIGLSQLALNKVLPFEIRDYLEKIYSSSNSLLCILNDILDFSKLEAGRLSIDNANFNLDELLANLSNLFADSANVKQLDFNIEITPDVPRNLVGDTLRLQQVLINLLGNSIKFTGQGSVRLNITAQQITQSNIRLLFCVTDTGIGMSATDLKKLFQPFSQADTTITRRFGGTGLGLVISHNLLQLMGSEISVTSHPGVGSCFSFELDLGVSSLSHQRKAVIVVQALVDYGGLLVGKRVLVAEDNPINQQVVSEFLKLSGIIVELANNGQEALALLEEGEFDAVLMDVHMPVLDGFEATKQIRLQTRLASLPIIALTAGVTKAEREKCMASGMNAFIAKPINPKKLMSTLVQWIKPWATTTPATVEPEVSLPGFDLRNLLLMLDNNQQFATQILLDFMDNMKDFPSEIEAMITSGNLVSAREKVHQIKGTSGNIGAVQLHTASERLETALKEGLATAALITFKEAFNQTMSVIARLHHEDLIPLTGSTIEDFKLSIAELDLMLKENDFIEDEWLNSFKSKLTEPQLDLFTQLSKLINALSYSEARKILPQLTELRIRRTSDD